jgi:5-methylcytosine-specific restriction endonuclease McrA
MVIVIAQLRVAFKRLLGCPNGSAAKDVNHPAPSSPLQARRVRSRVPGRSVRVGVVPETVVGRRGGKAAALPGRRLHGRPPAPPWAYSPTVATPNAKTCPVCGEELPSDGSPGRQFCSPRCQWRASFRRKAGHPIANPVPVDTTRVGEMKVCTTCGEAKPATSEFFQPYPRMTFGFRNQCRACVNARRKERYQPKPSRRELFAQTLSKTKVCSVCGKRKPRSEKYFPPDPLMVDGFRNECKRCRIDYRLNNRAENLDRDRATARRAYRKRIREHPEEHRAYMREYWRRNRDYLNAKGREYSKKYSADYYRAKALRRRTRELAAGGGCTEEDIERLHQEQQALCFYCGEEYGENYEVDHFIPVAAGGHSGPENMVIACQFCNRSKGGKMPWEFMPERFAPPDDEP